MSLLPGVNIAYEYEEPHIDDLAGKAPLADPIGAPWQYWPRDNYPVAPDMIRNHTTPIFLGVLDGTESVADWNPWEGTTFPVHTIRYGYGPYGLQEFAQDAPLAIDAFDRAPDHAQARLSGVGSIAGLVPFLELPDYGQGLDPSSISGFAPDDAAMPYHFDPGLQIDQAQAIGPRQVFRAPPTISDQTSAYYAAGF